MRNSVDTDSGLENDYDDFYERRRNSPQHAYKICKSINSEKKSRTESSKPISSYWKQWRSSFIKKSILCLVNQKLEGNESSSSRDREAKNKYKKNRKPAVPEKRRKRRPTHRACRGGRGRKKKKFDEVANFLMTSNQWDAVKALESKHQTKTVSSTRRTRLDVETFSSRQATEKTKKQEREANNEYKHDITEGKDSLRGLGVPPSTKHRRIKREREPCSFEEETESCANSPDRKENRQRRHFGTGETGLKIAEVGGSGDFEYTFNKELPNTKVNDEVDEDELHRIFCSTGAIFKHSPLDIDTSPETVRKDMEDLDNYIKRKIDLQNVIKEHQQQKAYFKWSAEKCAGIESKKRWRLRGLQRKLQKINERICSIDVSLCQETILSNVTKHCNEIKL